MTAQLPNPKKRPVHKANLLAGKVEAEKNRKHPEPMSLFHKREKAGEIPGFVLPKPDYGMGTVFKAATAMAEWDNSDPFAFKRTVLHVRQGYLLPDLIVKEMGQRTLARRVARAREVDNAKATVDGATTG